MNVIADAGYLYSLERGAKRLIDLLLPSQQLNYMFNVSSRNTRTRCEIFSKLTVKSPGRRHWRPSGVFIVYFGHISHLFLVFVLSTLTR